MLNAGPATGGRFDRFLDRSPMSRVGPFRALGFAFSLRVNDDDLATYLEAVLACLGDAGDAEHEYVVVDRGACSRLRRYVLLFDGRVQGRFTTPSVTVAYLLWHVNAQVVETSTEYALLHAAAVEYRGIGVLLPAPMESGKTTLAAGLVRAGLRYVTDECAAIHASTLKLHPFPKALSIDTGSWGVLADLRPRQTTPYDVAQWHVPPTSIRKDAVAPVCQPRLIVSPRYEEGTVTEITRLRSAEGLVVLAENSFDLSRRGAPGFRLLADVVRACRCYRLRVGNLDDACAAVLALVDREVSERAS